LKRNKTFTKKPRTKIEIKRKEIEAEKLKTKRTTQQFKGEREKKEKKERKRPTDEKSPNLRQHTLHRKEENSATVPTT
jgi:hypothetical protein